MFWESVVPTNKVTCRVDAFQVVFTMDPELLILCSSVGEQYGIVVIS